MRALHSNTSSPKIKRLIAPIRKSFFLRILPPVLLITWLICYIATLNAGMRTFQDMEERLSYRRSLFTSRLSDQNTYYCEWLRDASFDPDMNYTRYFHNIQLQLRAYDSLKTGSAAIICNTDGVGIWNTTNGNTTITMPEPELIDASEPRLFASVVFNYRHPEKTPDYRGDLICYPDMDEEYDRFVEASNATSQNIEIHIPEMYVNWETWEFIPKTIYCYSEPFPIYQTTVTPPDGFTLLVQDRKAYTEILSASFLGTRDSGAKALDDLKNNYPFQIHTNKYDTIAIFCDHSSRFQRAVSNVEEALVEANQQTFGTNKIRRTVPISMYDADGNLNTYYLTQEVIYRFTKLYGLKIFFAWFLATALALAVGGLLAELLYRKRCQVWQMESYRRSLTNTMAHDLKSPLMAIMGYAENLKEKTHPKKEAYYTQEIIRCTDYMNGIIADLLDLGKLEEIRIATEKEPVELAALITEIAENYRTIMEQKQLTFLADGIGVVDGDRKMLYRAFDCLINNAVNYTPESNDIHASISAHQVIITNRGISLSKKMCKKVFEPFVKQDQARSGQKGSGLGLSIAKEIFSAHGMTCRMESTDDAVSVFVRWR